MTPRGEEAARYRARLKADPVRYERAMATERARQARMREAWTPERRAQVNAMKRESDVRCGRPR